MVCKEFATPADLVKYVADQSIVQAKIVQIWCKDNRWYLFYYV